MNPNIMCVDLSPLSEFATGFNSHPFELVQQQ